MGDAFTINSKHSLTAFYKYAGDLFHEHKFITFDKPRIGKDRSLSQNALLHVFLATYCAHLLKKDRRTLSEAELEGMKLSAKARFYGATGHSWMVVQAKSPRNGKEKQVYRSSAKYLKGEMFEFLTWLQAEAANDGLILEAIGEFQRLLKEQTET